MRRGDVTRVVLETIEDAAVGMGDLFAALLSAGYGASSGRIDYEISKRERARARRRLDSLQEEKARERCASVLYKLKRDGLIAEKQSRLAGETAQKRFMLTKEGTRKLFFLRKRKKEELPQTFHAPLQSNTYAIVVFDIPESERRKRDWLRAQLSHLGLSMVQKSVWIGKVKIPKQFLEDLQEARIISYVEIFEITKTGSLEHLT
ncbi:MAG: CRISPR-associated endonuclease Cas2 [bacterium]|nr:CRISPR-associated endonuclease Cas2 [bacterium]